MNLLRTIIPAAIFLFAQLATAQIAVQYNFVGSLGDQASNPPASTGGGITASNFSRGPGISPTLGANSINSSGWTTASSRDPNDYYEFTLTTDFETAAAFSTMQYTDQRSGTGPGIIQLTYRIGTGTETLLTSYFTGASAAMQTIDVSSVAIGPNTTIRFRIYGYSSGGGGGTYRISNSLTLNTSFLPVVLESFSARTVDKQVELAWTSAQEIRHSYYAIEHSTDGQHFSELGRVTGQGDSEARNDYSYLHATPAPGVNYYRLRQVDYDGEFSFSGVVFARVGRPAGIRLYPTVATELLHVTWDAETDAITSWQVFDPMGREVLSGSFEGAGDELNISSLSENQYFIRFSGKGLETRTFLKAGR